MGRWLVNGVDSLTSRISQNLDTFLQPLSSSTKVYLKDTMHLLQILEGIVAESSYFLVTVGIGLLYTIIQHTYAMESVK